MADETGSAKESASHRSDKSMLIKQDEIDKLDVERRDKYLKRLKLENEKGKKAFIKEDEWLEVEGKKVLRKTRNAAGSLYTQYFFNRNRHKAEYESLTKTGKFVLQDPHTGAVIKTLELRSIDGKPFKAKGK
jgi:hypothetical protein